MPRRHHCGGAADSRRLQTPGQSHYRVPALPDRGRADGVYGRLRWIDICLRHLRSMPGLLLRAAHFLFGVE